MIGIEDIGVYIPENRIDNMSKVYQGNTVDKTFVKEKIGFNSLSRMNKDKNEDTLELCLKAFENLQKRLIDFDIKDVDFICVCTQNGEYQLPHTSALIHGKLNLSPKCAVFDLSLGCSGYIYALDVSRHFMQGNSLKKGLVFTCDPYSKIVSSEDKNTDLLFGDAATVTLLTDNEKNLLYLGKPNYVTKGSDALALVKKDNEPLFMDGRRIFNFALREGATTIRNCLEKNSLSIEDIDSFLFHQASLYVVQNLSYQLKLPQEKVPFMAHEYGNTVSSSIPIILQNMLQNVNIHTVLLCGFGVGLSVAAIPAFRNIS